MYTRTHTHTQWLFLKCCLFQTRHTEKNLCGHKKSLQFMSFTIQNCTFLYRYLLCFVLYACVFGLVSLYIRFCFIRWCHCLWDFDCSFCFFLVKKWERRKRIRENFFCTHKNKVNAQDFAIISNDNDTLIMMPLVSCVVVTYPLCDAISLELILSMQGVQRNPSVVSVLVHIINIAEFFHSKLNMRRSEWKYKNVDDNMAKKHNKNISFEMRTCGKQIA